MAISDWWLMYGINQKTEMVGSITRAEADDLYEMLQEAKKLEEAENGN